MVWSAGAVASLGGRIFRHGGGGASSASRAAPSALVAFGGHTRATTAQRTLISVVPRSAPAAPAAAFVRSTSTLGASRSKGIELAAAAAAALAFGGNAIDTPAFCSDADSDTNADADEPPTEEDIDALIRDTNQVRAESASNDAEAAALGIGVVPPTVPPPDAHLRPRTTEEIFAAYKEGPSIEDIQRIAEEACGDLVEAKKELIESITNLQTALEQYWLENPGDKECYSSNVGIRESYTVSKRGSDLGGRNPGPNLASELRLHGLCDIIYQELLRRGYTEDNRKEDLTKEAATAIANNMLKFDNDTWPYFSNGGRSTKSVQKRMQSNTRVTYRAMIHYSECLPKSMHFYVLHIDSH